MRSIFSAFSLVALTTASLSARVVVEPASNSFRLSNRIISVAVDASDAFRVLDTNGTLIARAGWAVPGHTYQHISKPAVVTVAEQSPDSVTARLAFFINGVEITTAATLESAASWFDLDIAYTIRAPELSNADRFSLRGIYHPTPAAVQFGIAGDQPASVRITDPPDSYTVKEPYETVSSMYGSYCIYKPFWWLVTSETGRGIGMLCPNPRQGRLNSTVKRDRGETVFFEVSPALFGYWDGKRGNTDSFHARVYLKAGNVSAAEQIIAEANAVYANHQADIAAQIRAEGLPTDPVFSDDQMARWSVPAAALSWIERDGIRFPLNHGRALMGTQQLSAQHHPAILKGYVMQGYNNARRPSIHRREKPDLATPEQLRERLTRWKEYGVVCSPATHAGYYRDFKGVAERWNIPGIADIDPRWVMPDGSLDWPRKRIKLADIYRDDVLAAIEKIFDRAAAVCTEVGNVWSINIDNELWMGVPSYSEDADRKWGIHCQRLWNDDTPAADTNGDGVTYNDVMGSAARTWADTRVPRDLNALSRKHPAADRLRYSFMSRTYAEYLDRLNRVVSRHDPDMMVLSVHMLKNSLAGTKDFTLDTAMPHVKGLGSNVYRSSIAMLAGAAAATFSKPYFFFETNELDRNDESGARWRFTSQIPFSRNFGHFVYTPQPNARRKDPRYTSDYAHFTVVDLIPGPMPVPGLEKDWPYRDQGSYPHKYPILQFDRRLLPATEIAPFVGRVSRPTASNTLFILGAPVLLERHAFNYVVDSHVVSDNTVTQLPDSIDFGQYDLIVYLNYETACFSDVVYEKLTDFVENGGTVVVNAYAAGSEPTVIGTDNRARFWNGLTPARTETSLHQGTTKVDYGGNTYETIGTWPYLAGPPPQGWQSVGTVSDSEGSEYPLCYVAGRGRGRWLMLNLPALYDMPYGWDRKEWPEAARDFTLPAWKQWYTRFGLLKRIAADYSGTELTDIAEVNQFQGDACVLAFAGAGQNRDFSSTRIRYSTEAKAVVAFDMHARRLVSQQPIAVKNGVASFEVNFDPWTPCGLWVVKDAAEPTLLYADGTVRYRGRYSTDTLRGNTLSFRFAEKAWVYAPSKPVSVEDADGKPLDFSCNTAASLLIIEGPGWETDVRIRF